MNEKKLSPVTAGFGLSLFITSIFSTLLVIIKEINEHTVLEWMKHATPHHWITHGVMVLAVFILLGMVLSKGKASEIQADTLVKLLVAAVVLSFVGVSGFYLTYG